MVEGQTLQGVQLEVLVTGIVSPIDTGSIRGRGHGVLRRDRAEPMIVLPWRVWARLLDATERKPLPAPS